MNNCGYYSCFKGRRCCKHPTYGDEKTQQMGRGYGSVNVCDWCKRANMGIYPDKVTKAQFSGPVDVVDKNGNVLN